MPRRPVQSLTGRLALIREQEIGRPSRIMRIPASRQVLLSILFVLVAIQVVPSQPVPVTLTTANASSLVGRWNVKFKFAGKEEKNLVFEAQTKGEGSFLLLDTAQDSKPEMVTHPAAWAQTTNDRFSFSAEVELPIGDCCREMGTLIFKGTFDSKTKLSGKVIFVASTTDEENPIGFRSLIGSFTANAANQ